MNKSSIEVTLDNRGLLSNFKPKFDNKPSNVEEAIGKTLHHTSPIITYNHIDANSEQYINNLVIQGSEVEVSKPIHKLKIDMKDDIVSTIVSSDCVMVIVQSHNHFAVCNRIDASSSEIFKKSNLSNDHIHSVSANVANHDDINLNIKCDKETMVVNYTFKTDAYSKEKVVSIFMTIDDKTYPSVHALPNQNKYVMNVTGQTIKPNPGGEVSNTPSDDAICLLGSTLRCQKGVYFELGFAMGSPILNVQNLPNGVSFDGKKIKGSFSCSGTFASKIEISPTEKIDLIFIVDAIQRLI